MNISGYIKESIVDGIGLRSVIFISGCYHKCPGCHSPQTHDKFYGEELSVERQREIISEIKSNPLLDGITLSGGDPFFSAGEMLPFIKLLKGEIPDINIWAYTGFTFEWLIKNKNNVMYRLLRECDVLVDGKFILEERDTTLLFKGSLSQRIIDVKESLNECRPIIYMS
ncbi:anaerobic ribonucleotide reductase-activating protein [compost metagenome]